MSKQDSIELEGTVIEVLPGAMFRVETNATASHVVLATLAGRLRQNKIRVLDGDHVSLEVSPYDLTKGRITYRHRGERPDQRSTEE